MTPLLSRRAAIKAGTGVALASALPARAAVAEDSNLLWYDAPATEWVQALPLGNGRLGAMVFGGVANERIQLNEDTFFAGSPYDGAIPRPVPVCPRYAS